MATAGVVQQSTGDWLWSCVCGASGFDPEREGAREQYKQHRRTCGTVSSQPEGQSIMATTTAKKKGAAAAKGKKAAAGKPRKVLLAATDPRLAAVVTRMKAGSSLIEEAKKLGFTHNGPLRAVLPKYLGGYQQYQALMAAYFQARSDKAEAAKSKKPAAKKPAAKPMAKKPAAKKPAAKKLKVPSIMVAAGEPEVVDVRNVPDSDKAGVPV